MIKIDAWLQQSMSSGGKLLVTEEELGKEFFDLSTGIAGQLMQKFVTYGQRLAIVVVDSAEYSARFRELAMEHNNHHAIRFFPSAEVAAIWLESQE